MKKVVFKVKGKHIVVFLCIIVLIAMMTFVPDNAEYVSILGQRFSLGASVARGTHQTGGLNEEYLACQERLEYLSNSSAYGAFLANQDQNGGKVIIAVVFLIQIIAIFFSGILLWAAITVFCEKSFKRFMRKLYRWANAKSRSTVNVRRKNSK